MPGWRRTYRLVEGRRVEGTWRPIFIHNGGYYLTPLLLYADGLIDCGAGLITFDEFWDQVALGWVATTIPEGARASVHLLASWTFTDPVVDITPDELVAEVADELAQLAGRPTSSDRCRAAADALRAELTEERRAELRRAYEAVPRHLRPFLGTMDDRDLPFQILMTPVGERRDGTGPVVHAADHEQALAWFAEQHPEPDPWAAEERARAARELPFGSATVLAHGVFPNGWPDPPGLAGLQSHYPAPISVDGRTYPSVHHAFWARSVAGPADHDRIVAEPNPYRARQLAVDADPRPGWQKVQLTVMADLLRAKFAQHPELARLLLATGDGPILYQLADSPFWGTGQGDGRNWLGRLLELVRAELAA